MASPIEPFWFKQRQCKAEAQPDGALKVSGPNLAEAFLRVRPEGDRWTAALRTQADGSDVAAAEAPTEQLAWGAAFELYRQHVIV